MFDCFAMPGIPWDSPRSSSNVDRFQDNSLSENQVRPSRKAKTGAGEGLGTRQDDYCSKCWALCTIVLVARGVAKLGHTETRALATRGCSPLASSPGPAQKLG